MASSRFFATGDSSGDSSAVSAEESENEIDMAAQMGGNAQVKLVYSSSEVSDAHAQPRHGVPDAHSRLLRILRAPPPLSTLHSARHHSLTVAASGMCALVFAC
jgi:hypothetical protein